MNIEQILNDGIIDAEEVVTIREAIFADGKVDREEVETLFVLKDRADEVCQEFNDLLIESVKSCVMEDGVIDAEEKAWLRELIEADGEIDEVEQEILALINA